MHTILIWCFIAITQNGFKNIDVDTFKSIAQNKNITILDVRTAEEVKSGKIKNAIHIDFFDKEFDNKINLLDKSKPVYVYCKVGGRSIRAAEKLIKSGFNTVYNLTGGIDAWKAKNYPTVTK
jgi:rhodanese-related sulfurtransferase